MTDAILIIHEKDNVAVALRDLAAGEKVASGSDGTMLTVSEPVPASHKLALRDIEKGGAIIKYGETIGLSTGHIRQGQWVHIHNLESGPCKAQQS